MGPIYIRTISHEQIALNSNWGSLIRVCTVCHSVTSGSILLNKRKEVFGCLKKYKSLVSITVLKEIMVSIFNTILTEE